MKRGNKDDVEQTTAKLKFDVTYKRYNFLSVLWQPLHWNSNTASQDTFTTKL